MPPSLLGPMFAVVLLVRAVKLQQLRTLFAEIVFPIEQFLRDSTSQIIAIELGGFGGRELFRLDFVFGHGKLVWARQRVR